MLAVVGVVSALPFAAAHATRRPPELSSPPPVPRVLGIHPDVVRGKGGSTVVVHGSGFTSTTTVAVDGVRARVLSFRNSGALVVALPPGIGTEVVRARNSTGVSAANERSVVHFVTKVLVVGDSLGIDLGWGFTSALDARDGLSVTDLSVGSTGLVRTDYYDWPSHLRTELAQLRPDVVVTLFGTNDEQALPTSRGLAEPATAGWNRVYAARVRQIATIVHRAAIPLVWVGLPRMGPRSILSSVFVTDVIRLDRSTLAHEAGAVFVDTWGVFTTASGAYTPYVLVGPHDWALGHAADDTHLTPDGAAVMDAKAMNALRKLLTGS